MDHFGIGQAVRGMMRIYCQSARQTGRTTALVESVKDGDRICFLNVEEANRVNRLCKDRGVEVDCIVIPLDALPGLFNKPPSKGRTIFDHSWVEAYYLQALDKASSEIDHFECETSGFGAAHRETQQKAREISKWHF